MKLLKGYAVLSQKELDEALRNEYKRGQEVGAKDSKARIESLETGIERKDKTIAKLEKKFEDYEESTERQIENLEAKIEVYEEERDEARDVVKEQIKNADMKEMLEAKKEGLDAKEAKLKDRETKLGTEEDKRYKEGYADGVADGVRKISEITATDRENAMKVAMVAAASHTSPEVVKELNGNVKSLTEGTQNTEA